MDNYLVSARKYRPSTFRDVVGQTALASTLKNAVATGRLAHSYLFCGSRGVGKTTCARIMAKTINCEHPTPDGEACNECPSCQAFNNGNSLNIIELDAASNNGVDDMRALIEQVQVPPASGGKYRVFIIDEVHMLSSAAFNAFLKTLEEPPSYVVFILATTEKHKILPTILSRCQIYDFNRISIQDMINHLTYVASREGITVEPEALNIISRKADGAMRDALSIFDQVAASTRGNITYQATIDNLNVLDYEYYNRLLTTFLEGDVLSAWLIYKEIRDRGFDSQFFINGLASYMRDLMVARDPRSIVLLEAGDEAKQQMAAMGAKCDPQFLYRAMNLCNEADLNYRTASNKQFLVELTLAKLCQLLSPSPVEPDGKGGGLSKIAVNPAKSASTQPVKQPEASPQSPAPQAASPRSVSEPKTSYPAADKATPATSTTTVQPPAQAHTARGGRLSLRGVRKDQEDNAASALKAEVPKRNEAYTDNDMRKAWEAYADARPTEHILINTMRSSLPQRAEGNRFIVTVENDRQLALLNEQMPKILEDIHRNLLNDNIEVTISVNEGEASPVTWNQREVLKHMVHEIPYLSTLINDLGLTLS